MATTTQSLLNSVEVHDVQKAFERWRSGKKHGREPIPPKLWRMAAALCGTYSLNRVARRLGLDYTALKAEVLERSPDFRRPSASRLGGRSRPRRRKPAATTRPAFVELAPAGITAGPSSAEYVVEAPDRRNGTPRIHVRGASVLEVATLVRALRIRGGR